MRASSQNRADGVAVDELLRSMQELAADDKVVIQRAEADSRVLDALRKVETILGTTPTSEKLSEARDVLVRLDEEPSTPNRSPDVAAAVKAAGQLLAEAPSGVREQIHHASTDLVADRVRRNTKDLTVRLFEARRLSDGAETNVRALEFGLAHSY